MSEIKNVFNTKLFSRQTNNSSQKTTPVHSNTPSPAGSRSRANSYDMECFNKLLKHYEETGETNFKSE